MAIRKIPTTADIYLEVNGVRVAVVQSYKVTASRESKAIYAFGQSEPVSTIRGQSQYVLELTRLYATDEAIRDGLNFCDMDDFSLVVCKPDRNVIYTGCQWKSLQESAEVGGNVLEKVLLGDMDKIRRTLEGIDQRTLSLENAKAGYGLKYERRCISDAFCRQREKTARGRMGAARGSGICGVAGKARGAGAQRAG